MKINRQKVQDRCGGRCGYCGRKIDIKEMQVDHMKPKCIGGGNHPDNLMPSCRSCNHYKRSYSIEGFRLLMKDLHKRVQNVYIHKVAVNFAMATVKPFDGTFYFERMTET